MCRWLQTSHHPLRHQHLMGSRPFQLQQEWMKFGFWTVASKVHFFAVHLPNSSSFLMENLSVSLDHRWEVKSEDLVSCHLSNSSEEVLSEVDVFTASIYKMPCVLSEKARDPSQTHFSTHGQRSNVFCPFPQIPFFYGLSEACWESVHW